MTEITKLSQYIEQECRIHGEKWRGILFKKWTFQENIRPEDSYVHLVTNIGPELWETRIYDTEEEATKELTKSQNERLKKVINKTYWTIDDRSHWVFNLENDINFKTNGVFK